jgi:hypothetical protein
VIVDPPPGEEAAALLCDRSAWHLTDGDEDW